MIITVNIEAETPEEYRKGLQALSDGLSQSESIAVIPTPELIQAPEKKSDPVPDYPGFKKTSYFYTPESDSYHVFKKGDEIPEGQTYFELSQSITKKEYDAGIKKQKEEAAAEKKTGDPAASTDSTSGTEPSKTGEPAEPTEKEDVEKDVSATQGKYPDATKSDIVVAMQEAQKAGKLSAVKSALGRFNATKISELKEEHFSAFLTDLEVLVKG
ncbi:hypothetical protein [Candidatus Enterococcus clewellii]|uniref:Uncharacterized protein n=1 Tax=Candidatus Enterococcus clewellii TaxID=1834193 RepID=A0A242K3N5_9ENTE|nr:hypothetical protein [Enterococcus sp. 9E7_DIV0242]OTP13410.1 hypothetical protein A5888_002888 [Enterococcus sp. 9E7_DIV0242]